MRACALFLFFLALLAAPQTAHAHPHIFAHYHVAIAPGESGYFNLHFTFTFQGVPNPILTPGNSPDQPQLGQDMLANLVEHPFYLYLDMDGQNIGRQMVRPISVAQKNEKEKTYIFDLAIPATVKNFSFALYDPDYFVFVRTDGADAVTTKSLPVPCTVEEREVGRTVWGVLKTQYVVCGEQKPSETPLIKNKSMEDGSRNHRMDSNEYKYVP